MTTPTPTPPSEETLKRIITRLRKIYELTIRGCDGERETAERMLRNALRKYEMQLTDILPEDAEVRKTWWYHYATPWEKRLLRQCFCMVCSPDVPVTYRHKQLKGQLGCDLTHCQMVELDVFYHKYKILWKEEMEMFFVAFLNKHDIFSHRPNEQKSKDPDENELSYADSLKLQQYMQGMDDANIHRQLCQLES